MGVKFQGALPMPTDHPCVHMSLFPLVLVSTGHQGRDEMVGNLKKQVVSTRGLVTWGGMITQGCCGHTACVVMQGVWLVIQGRDHHIGVRL